MVFIIVFLMVICAPAYAYIDPGTGSMILQGILAFIAAVGAGVAGYWSKVKALFHKLKKKK